MVFYAIIPEIEVKPAMFQRNPEEPVHQNGQRIVDLASDIPAAPVASLKGKKGIDLFFIRLFSARSCSAVGEGALLPDYEHAPMQTHAGTATPIPILQPILRMLQFHKPEE